MYNYSNSFEQRGLKVERSVPLEKVPIIDDRPLYKFMVCLLLINGEEGGNYAFDRWKR